jgi:hypothetical protein
MVNFGANIRKIYENIYLVKKRKNYIFAA